MVGLYNVLPYKVKCPVCKNFFKPRHASQVLCENADCHGVMTKDENLDVSLLIRKELDKELEVTKDEAS